MRTGSVRISNHDDWSSFGAGELAADAGELDAHFLKVTCHLHDERGVGFHGMGQ